MRLVASLIIWMQLCLSCASDPLTLRSAKDAPTDWTELRRRMNIRVLDGPPGSEEEVELEPADFEPIVGADCEARLDTAVAVLPDPPDDGIPGVALYLASCAYAKLDDGADTITVCEEAACLAHLQLCMADRYLELARSVAPVSLTGDNVVPPQSRATNAGLSEAALHHAREALIRAGENLRHGAVRQDDEGTDVCNSSALLTSMDGFPANETLGYRLSRHDFVIQRVVQNRDQRRISEVAEVAGVQLTA